jgi:hypothetical protein
MLSRSSAVETHHVQTSLRGAADATLKNKTPVLQLAVSSRGQSDLTMNGNKGD